MSDILISLITLMLNADDLSTFLYNILLTRMVQNEGIATATNNDVDESESRVHVVPRILRFVRVSKIFDSKLTRNFLTFFFHSAQLLISRPK